jgi:XTP/dITP diphosphohydrolase
MKHFKKILAATRNPSKVEYYRSILLEVAEEVISLKDLDIKGKPAETGDTAEANAVIKARYYSQLSTLPTFSEDEALFADFLPVEEQPGTHVRRIYGVDEVDDATLLKHWEKIIAKVPKNHRTGRWHIAYCVLTPDGKHKIVSMDHPLLFFSPSSKIRLPGWPMSSLEGSAYFGKPNSELTSEEKEISKLKVAEGIKKALNELVDF